MRVVLLEQPVGDRRAQPLERLVGALLCDQVGRVAHLGVVDGVLDPVGDGRIDVADVHPEVEQQALPHLALCRGHAHVGEQRQSADLDRDLGFGMALALVLVYLVVLVGVVHRALTVAAVTASASWTGATSWTLNTRAPRSYAS